jgi:hypothetical protein
MPYDNGMEIEFPIDDDNEHEGLCKGCKPMSTLQKGSPSCVTPIQDFGTKEREGA